MSENSASGAPEDESSAGSRLRALLHGTDDIFRSHLLKAAELVAANGTAPEALRRIVVRELGAMVRALPHSAVRREAIDRLAAVGGPDVAGILASIAMTNSLPTDVRQAALAALRRTSCEAKVAAHLTDDVAEDLVLGVEAAWTLAHVGLAARAADVIVQAARTHVFSPQARTRLQECCAEVDLPALGTALLDELRQPGLPRRLGCSIARLLIVVRPLPPLSDAVSLLTDPTIDALVRRDFAEALSEIDDPAMGREMIELIRRPTVHAGVRARLALSLGAMCRSEVAEDVVKLLTDGALDVGLRSRLASAFCVQPPRRVVRQLLKLLRNERVEPPVRRAIARALGAFANPKLSKQIRGLLQEESLDLGVRARLSQSLIGLGDEQTAIAAMSRLVTEKWLTPVVRARIARQIAALDHLDVVPALRGVLAVVSDETVRQEIVGGLVRTGQADMIGDLVGYIRQRAIPLGVRQQMVDALASTANGGPAKGLMLDLLDDRRLDGNLRRFIGEKVGPLCGPEEVDRLIAIADDEKRDLSVRIDAAWALGLSGNTPETVAALTALLQISSAPYGCVYTALRNVCRRTGASVYPEAVGWTPMSYL